MRVKSFRSVPGAVAVVWAATLAGCGNEDIKLKEAPPVPIGAAKEEKATKSQSSLRSGAPPVGSSAGMNHNPSETPPINP
jgi:hypothetical protein